MRLFGKSQQETVEITVSNRTVIKILLLVVVTILGMAALKQAQHALILIFIAVFLALAFNAPVQWIARHIPGKRRGDRTLGTALSFFLVVLILGVFLASIVPPIVRQTSNLVNNAPDLIRDLRDDDSSVGQFIDRYNLEPQVEKFSDELGERAKNATGTAFSTLSQIGSSLFATLTVFVLTFMMLIEGPHWMSWFRKLVPDRNRKDVEKLSEQMYSVVKGYVNGQVTLAAIAAILILPMLLILDISYPFALVFVVFICGLIPMIGHTIGALIVSLVALLNSPLAALIILGYYILYQQIENYVVTPRIQANSTNLSPLLVFVAVVIGVSFSGLLGGLVAIPIMGCLRVLVLYWLSNRNKSIPAAKPKA